MMANVTVCVRLSVLLSVQQVFKAYKRSHLSKTQFNHKLDLTPIKNISIYSIFLATPSLFSSVVIYPKLAFVFG